MWLYLILFGKDTVRDCTCVNMCINYKWKTRIYINKDKKFKIVSYYKTQGEKRAATLYEGYLCMNGGAGSHNLPIMSEVEFVKHIRGINPFKGRMI